MGPSGPSLERQGRALWDHWQQHIIWRRRASATFLHSLSNMNPCTLISFSFHHCCYRDCFLYGVSFSTNPTEKIMANNPVCSFTVLDNGFFLEVRPGTKNEGQSGAFQKLWIATTIGGYNNQPRKQTKKLGRRGFLWEWLGFLGWCLVTRSSLRGIN